MFNQRRPCAWLPDDTPSKQFKRQPSFSGQKIGSFTDLTGAPFYEG